MVGGKYIDGQYIMQMKSLNKEPMEHGRSRVFQEHVEALTKDGLIQSKVLIISKYITVVENHRKSLIQHCERSELRLHFEWTKVH